MKKYNKPEIELIKIDCADVIATSGSKLDLNSGSMAADDTGKSTTNEYGGLSFNNDGIIH